MFNLRAMSVMLLCYIFIIIIDFTIFYDETERVLRGTCSCARQRAYAYMLHVRHNKTDKLLMLQ